MHKYPTTSPFKRGDSFVLTCTYKVDGVATTLVGVSIKSQLDYSFGSKVCNLVATKDPDQTTNPGLFSLVPVVGTDTKTWKAPVDLLCDIEFSKDGVVFSTSTFKIPVEKDITL
jgi:hypothetical protein